MVMSERRRVSAGMQHQDDDDHESSVGVGGRQPAMPAQTGGGGYQGNCTASNAPLGPPTDPRLADLRAAGLSATWLTAADRLGFDTFIELWRILDAAVEHQRENGDHGRITIPMYSSYERVRRDQFILHLDAQGLSAENIRRRVAHDLSERISARHVCRVIRRYKLAP